jgi:hypothetical protein
MLAAGAAAVLGQEMLRRLRRTAAPCAENGAGGAAAGAACGINADSDAPDAAVLKDQTGQHGTAATCSSRSSKGTGPAGTDTTATEAAWRLVCVTEQWAGGQLLPPPLTLLLKSLGCHSKAFLLLACLWQQQQPQQQQQAGDGNRKEQAGDGSSPQSQSSSQQASPQVLADLWQAYKNVFSLSSYSCHDSSSLTASDALLQRLSCCHAKGQHQHQHMQQHLLLAVLLMREAVTGRARGMFQSPTSPDAASSLRPEPLGKCALSASSAAAACVSTWLCWAHYTRQQRPAAGPTGPAAAGDPTACSKADAAASQIWDLGGKVSSGVLLEVLQGQCLLLQEGARELQAVTSRWAAARSSADSDNSASNPDIEVNATAGGQVSDVDSSVAALLGEMLGVLRALLAAAAVDSGVLQQAAPSLFGLAGTLEQLVRLRCACHRDRLALSIDPYVLQLLQLLLGSQDLSAYTELRQDAGNKQQQQQLSRACHDVQACGLLPFLALDEPLGSQQHRQLLGLLFSALKLFSTYPTGLYPFSSQEGQYGWLLAACDTMWGACAAGRLLLVTGGPGGWDVVTGAPRSSQAAGSSGSTNGSCSPNGCGSASGSTGRDQRQGQDSTLQGAAGGHGSSCHSCGLGAEGTAALFPWMVLQGRALQLWVTLFRAYVQLPPAEGSKAASKSCQGPDPHQQPCSLVGSTKALNLLGGMFEEAVAPSTQVLGSILTGGVTPAENPFAANVQNWQLQRVTALLPPAMRQGYSYDHMWYGMPALLWPQVNPADEHDRLTQLLFQLHGQLDSHGAEHGLILKPLTDAGFSAKWSAMGELRTFMATSDGLKKLGDSAQTQQRLRGPNVRLMLKSWGIRDHAVVLKGVLARWSAQRRSRGSGNLAVQPRHCI